MRAMTDQPDIGRDAARRIVEGIDRKHDLRHGDDSVAALVRITASMRAMTRPIGRLTVMAS